MCKNRVRVVRKLQKKEVRLFNQHAKRTEESQELYSGFDWGTSMTPTYKERNIACLSNILLSGHHFEHNFIQTWNALCDKTSCFRNELSKSHLWYELSSEGILHENTSQKLNSWNKQVSDVHTEKMVSESLHEEISLYKTKSQHVMKDYIKGCIYLSPFDHRLPSFTDWWVLQQQHHWQTSFGIKCNLCGWHSIESVVVWYLHHQQEEQPWSPVQTLALMQQYLMEEEADAVAAS